MHPCIKTLANRIKCKYVIFAFILIIVLDYAGVFLMLWQRDYFVEFEYPLEEDITSSIAQLRNNQPPDIAPINKLEYHFTIKLENKCKGNNDKQKIRLLLVIKSAAENFEHRNAIRNTWGFEKRFSDAVIKRVFMLGKNFYDPSLQQKIQEESTKNLDIVQADFQDSYYNNTIKTLMSQQWIYYNCPEAQYMFFADDDMYVSVKNIFRMLHNPYHYPQYLEQPFTEENKNNQQSNLPEPSINNLEFLKYNTKTEEHHLLTGYVFFSAPMRHRFSKWFIGLEEYPFSKYPPYVTAGAYVMSSEVLKDMYLTSLYTKYFKFDDVYLGLVAKKSKITPLHNENFYYWKKPYDMNEYKYVIASHGYDDQDELVNVWNEQRALGNA